LRTRTRHHEHLSVIGAMTVSPRRRRLGWYLKIHPRQSIRQQQVIQFVSQLLRHVRGPIVLLWDRLNAHRGQQVEAFLSKHPRVHVELLPAYAPELNPNEYGWAHLKGAQLGNYCPDDLNQLHHAVNDLTPTLKTNQRLIRGCIAATKLPLRIPQAA
jgi:transposase